ncbi:hypothetical protein C8A01DRAFT_36006 [Parachaetomium inaequale]|uniref:DUF7729 domain-containing protein n=1 Tax=Parachaetomium inaequale TaxID=2588326 RepID=A0AAN6PFC8_9PEZI|nr:hypothetical protein C8A01DRAFT_36006 [Parachaetomium inaequale]
MTSAAASSPAGQAPLRSSRPGRRLPSMHRRPTTPLAVILAVFVCFVSHALAAAPNAAVPVETLAVDHRSPYQGGQRWAMLPAHELQRRKVQKRATSEESESTTESSDSTTESSERSKTSATASVTTTFSIAVGSSKPSSSSTTVSASPLPSILDSMASEFSPGPNGAAAPCPIFINSFLTNPTFKKCYPLSMLFDRSRSFFEAQRSLVSITRTLDATCAANATFCSTYLAELAQNLTATENCGTDYQLGLSSVVDAYRAMLAYAPVYSAGCLRDPDTKAYCYANAVTNLTNPSTTYFYFLPLNKSLPATTVPACGYCLQQTMTLYQAATADRRQLIANTYVSAAKQANVICGPGFVNETLAAEVIPSGAAVVVRVSAWLATALPLLVGAAVVGVV